MRAPALRRPALSHAARPCCVSFEAAQHAQHTRTPCASGAAAGARPPGSTTRHARPARWATKQRTERARGVLGGDKAEALEALGFQWDEDEAEWLRWFIDLAR